MNLADSNSFYASENNPVKVLVNHDIPQKNLELFPLPKACSKCFRESAIANAIGAVEWDNMTGSMFDPNSLLSLCISCGACLGLYIDTA